MFSSCHVLNSITKGNDPFAILLKVCSALKKLACSVGIFWRANAQYFVKCVDWILNEEEDWGEKEISTKGVVDRQEEGGGSGEGKKNTLLTFSYPPPPCPLLPKSNMAARQTITSL